MPQRRVIALAAAVGLGLAGTAAAAPARSAPKPHAVAIVKPLTGAPGGRTTIYLDKTVVPKGARLRSVTLTYGDGSKIVHVQHLTSRFTHRYAKPGRYRVTETVTTTAGARSTSTSTVTVTAPHPTAGPTATAKPTPVVPTPTTTPGRPPVDVPVTYKGATVTAHLSPVALHAPTFAVYTQNADGSLTKLPTPPEHSYLGTVAGRPDAYAAATLMGNGSYHGEVVFDRGATWFFDVSPTGVGTVTTRGAATADPTAPAPATYAWPTTPNLADGARATGSYAFTEGVDVSNDWLTQRVGGDTTRAEDIVEASMNEIRATWQHDALLEPLLGPVVLRTTKSADPYNGMTSNSDTLPAIRAQWNGPLATLGAEGAMGVYVSTGGGLAYKTHYADGSYAYASCDSDDDGDFAIFCRHELGHNWGEDDHQSGDSEGATIMQGNAYARFGGSEVQVQLDTRDILLNDGGKLAALGTYTRTAEPPVATLDLLDHPTGASTVHPLANDYSANGLPLHLVSADATSADGGTVTTAPDGTLTYTPPANGTGLDHVTYRIADSAGMTATGVLLVRLTG